MLRLTRVLRAFAEYPNHTKLGMPLLSPTMTTGSIVKWFKKEGETVKAGEIMFQVQTDKATLGFEVQDQVVLAKILEPEGSQNLPLGHPVAILVQDQQDAAAFSNFTLSSEPQKPSTPAPETPIQTTPQTKSPQKPTPITKPPSNKTFISPLAKNLSIAHNVDYSKIQGSGPRGRIIKDDIIAALSQPSQPIVQQTVPPDRPFTDVPHSAIRRVIASRLLQSKLTIPHFYLSIQCQIDKLFSLRKQLNQGDLKISINDFVIKAASLACLKIPQANATWNSDSVRIFDYVDMSVAVQTEKGLITPIVKNAHYLRLGEISTEMKRLANSAREGSLKPEEYQGGTFTISNLGMFGVKSFSAIINPPQACILAVGTGDSKVVKTETGFEEVSTMNVTLSCDHRVVDGAVGAEWLQAFKGYMEDPITMLV